MATRIGKAFTLAPSGRARDREGALADIMEELRGASDALLRDLERLAALEERKRRVMPGDPQLVGLAAEVEELAHRVFAASVEQRAITRHVDELAREDPERAPDSPIDPAPLRELHLILRDWRDAERRASETAVGSADASAAIRDAAQFRLEYRTAQEAAGRRSTDRGD